MFRLPSPIVLPTFTRLPILNAATNVIRAGRMLAMAVDDPNENTTRQ